MSTRFWLLRNGAMFTAAPVFFLAISVLAGEDERSAADPSNFPDHRAVLRISDALINSVLGENDVDRQVAVQDVILGTSIYGAVRIVGKPRVQLTESPDQATFKIVFNGTAYSRTTGYNGPAIIHSRSTTTFTATRQIILEPGRGFQGLSPTVTASTQTFVEGIDSTRGGGLVGGIVRSRAARIEASQHAEVTEIARRKAEQRIAVAFERSSEQRLARLNWIADLRSMAAMTLRATGNGDPKYVCRTTPHYIEIASSFGNHSSAIDLPGSAAAATQRSQIEIWLHESLFGDGNAASLDRLGAQINASDLAKVISATAIVAGGNPDTTTQLQSILGEHPIHAHKSGKWRVLEWGFPTHKLQPVASANTTRELETPLSATSAAPNPAVPVRLASATNAPGNRIWTSGKYTADAEFISLDGNLVRLRRTTGIRTSIPLEKLSAADRDWIQAHLAEN